MKSHPLTSEHALTFILGGKSTFTIKSTRTGKHFTYKVNAPRANDKDTSTIFWVRMLNGSDNEGNYGYIGFIKNNGQGWDFYHGGGKAFAGKDAPGVVAISYTFNNFVSLCKQHPEIEIWHEGKCCRCGRTLTVPESIESGIGPECIKIKARKNALAI
jgi:hypothetical protein